MTLANQTKGFFVSFDFTSNAMTEHALVGAGCDRSKVVESQMSD